MICPILSIDPGNGFSDCEREKCAWWDKQNERCGVLTIAQAAGDIVYRRELQAERDELRRRFQED